MDYLRDIKEFKHALSLSEEILNKEYLRQLKMMSLSPTADVADTSSIQLIRLKNIPESCCSYIIERMIPVLAALHHLGTAIGYILRVTPAKVTAYLAIQSIKDIYTSLKLIENALDIKDSNLFIEVIDTNKKNDLLSNLFNQDKITSLSSVIINPTFRSNTNKGIFSELQELHKLMGSEEYILFFLATPAEKEQIKDSIYQLENLCTLLDSFKITTFTYNHNTSDTCTNNASKSDSQNLSHTTSESETLTTSKELDCKNLNTLITNYDVDDSLDFCFNTQTIKATDTKNICASTHSTTDADQTTRSHSKSEGQTNAKGNSMTYSFTGINKTSSELLKKTDFTLNQFYDLQSIPQFNFGIYFLSPHTYTTLRATFTYLDLLKRNKENVCDSCITTWDTHDAHFNRLFHCLSKLSHPSFIKARSERFITPTSWIDHQSLAHLMCIPTLSHLT
ncbi:MAG: hypothetical protein K0S71_2773 [Clostridia bacterium]|jgi:hypothetical protein|nr:hypothetical protein [Clostridia bacterium]